MPPHPTPETPEPQTAALRTLLDVTREIIAADSQDIFDLVCRRAAELLKAPKALIAVFQESGALHLKGAYGIQQVDRVLAKYEDLIQQEFKVKLATSTVLVQHNCGAEDGSFMDEFRQREEICSLAAAPMINPQGPIGILLVLDTAPHAWEGADREILSLLAGQAAIALQKLWLYEEATQASQDNARLYQTEARRTARLLSMQRITIELAGLREEDALLDLLACRACETAPNTFAAVMLLNADCQIGVMASAYGPHGVLPKAGQLELPAFISDELLDGRPVIITDVDGDAPQFRSWFDTQQSVFLFPLRRAPITFGALILTSATVRVPSSAETTAYLLLADRAAVALENARLFEDAQHRNQQLARLYRASGLLIASTSASQQALMETIVSSVLNEFGKSNCSLVLVQDDSIELKRAAVAGPYADEVSKGSLALDGRGIIPKAIRTGQAIYVPDVWRDPDYLPNWKSARSEMALPLIVGQRVLGVIDIQSSALNAFSPSDEQVMKIFAEQSALALEHARLYEQTIQNLQRLTGLRTVDQAINANLDLSETLKILLEQVIQQLQVDAADLLLTDHSTQTLFFAAGLGFRTRIIEEIRLPFGQEYAGRIVNERCRLDMPAAAQATDAHSSLFAAMQASEGFAAYIGVPLIIKDQVKGVLEVHHRTPLAPTKGWLDYLETLAGQAAIAVDNASLVADLQRSNQELFQAYQTTLEGWSRGLDLRDEVTEGHTQRVTELTARLAQRMGLKDADLLHVKWGALLHDIGKMGVPDSILRKEGLLTPEEEEIMRRHPIYAFEWLAPISYLEPALAIPYCHHERWDGKGYPRQLKGEQIPLPARVFAVVDVWDALRSDRSYRKAWPKHQAMAYILSESGKHFDPHVVDVFLEMMAVDDAAPSQSASHIQ